jgi:hypothetical protein
MVTDANGSFTLRGFEGKRLEVSVAKNGYYSSNQGSRKSFEFSNPGEEMYYEPDSTHPIVFRLQKKGAGEKLISKSIKIVTPTDGTVTTVDLNSGHPGAGDLEVQTWKPATPQPVSIMIGRPL